MRAITDEEISGLSEEKKHEIIGKFEILNVTELEDGTGVEIEITEEFERALAEFLGKPNLTEEDVQKIIVEALTELVEEHKS